MAKPLFNMSRTLSIGNEGPRALEFALGPVYLGWNPRWTAHVWFDAVRQFNIRPSRMKCRCISLLRLAPPCRFVYLLACVAASPPHKKSADGVNARRARGFRERPSYVCGAPAMPLGHAAHGLARQLARYRDVGHARLLAGGVHRAPPVDQPPHARVGVAARIGRDGLAFGRPLRRARRTFVMSCGLDQQLPQVDLLHYFGQIYEGLRNTKRKVPTWQTPGIRGSSRRSSSGR